MKVFFNKLLYKWITTLEKTSMIFALPIILIQIFPVMLGDTYSGGWKLILFRRYAVFRIIQGVLFSKKRVELRLFFLFNNFWCNLGSDFDKFRWRWNFETFLSRYFHCRTKLRVERSNRYCNDVITCQKLVYPRMIGGQLMRDRMKQLPIDVSPV